MKQLLLIALISSFTSCFAQEKKTFKDYFNEFHVSVNHGVPLNASDRAFFGGGLGMSHVFLMDRTVGARTGLELECFHITDYNAVPPESDKARSNQHFYLTSLTIPLNLRINFGEKKNIFLELGGKLGFVAFGYYTADILETGPITNLIFNTRKPLKLPWDWEPLV